MRTRNNPNRYELRGGELLPSMIFAATIVMVAVGAVALHQYWWVVGIAVAVEIAVIVGGVLWVLPLLGEGETPDEVAPEDADDQATVISITRRMADPDDRADDGDTPAQTPDHTPHVAA